MVRALSKICFALVIQEESERVLIGPIEEIENALMGRQANTYYDRVRTIGTFLFELNGGNANEQDGEIERLVEMLLNLCDATEKMKSTKRGHPKLGLPTKKYVQNAEIILKEKLDCDNAVIKYIVLKLWELYWEEEEKPKRYRDSGKLYRRGSDLIYPLDKRTKNGIVEDNEEQLTKESGLFNRTLHFSLQDAEIRMTYPNDKIRVQYAYVYGSVLGLLPFYADKLIRQKWHISRCGCCQNLFLAKNLKKAFCSRACERENAKVNRRMRRQNPEKLELERLVNRENRYWDYRIGKIQQSVAENKFFDEAIAARTRFREEQRDVKLKLKAGQITLSNLKDWYRQQRDIVDEIMDRFNRRE